MDNKPQLRNEIVKVYILETIINGKWVLFNGEAFAQRKAALGCIRGLREEGYKKSNLRVGRYVRDIQRNKNAPHVAGGRIRLDEFHPQHGKKCDTCEGDSYDPASRTFCPTCKGTGVCRRKPSQSDAAGKS